MKFQPCMHVSKHSSTYEFEHLYNDSTTCTPVMTLPPDNLVNTSPILLTVCWMMQVGNQTTSHHWESCKPS